MLSQNCHLKHFFVSTHFVCGQVTYINHLPSLTLTQENDDDRKADVLDMNVEINGLITTSVYCKADAFPFQVQ